jgi:hypothetical protein
MKKGQEPLRSFSDLLQFYEVKRTDTQPNVTPAQPSAPAAEPTPAPPAVDNSADQPPAN